MTELLPMKIHPFNFNDRRKKVLNIGWGGRRGKVKNIGKGEGQGGPNFLLALS